MPQPLLFELSREGRQGVALPECDVPQRPAGELLPDKCVRADLPLPQLSEVDVARHFTNLSRENFSVDTHFYPLGSCTMKYNPKINEAAAGLAGFRLTHPYQPVGTVQGLLAILHDTERSLCEISGMDYVTLQPSAGAHGEATALMVIDAYFRDRAQDRDVVLIPDSAHGTNPASCTLCGYRVVPVKSASDGGIELDDLRGKASERVAALMLTNPNTLGLFEDRIREIAEIVHAAGAQLYMDGANMNAILGLARPGDFGVDVMHFNLHKTFSTPHGGGGPGAGPVGAKAHLEPYLPIPVIERKGDEYRLVHDRPKSIGRMRSFVGNVGVVVRAYAYIRSLGASGLKAVAENAVINANYLLAELRASYCVPYDRPCMHEFVLSASEQEKRGVRALDIAKRLLDFGIHPPTMYFPLIVPHALMIEPTETESKETLDSFVETMVRIAEEAETEPEKVTSAPHGTPVSRLDEVRAGRELVLRFG